MTVDTKKSVGGPITAEIKLDEEKVDFELKKVDESKYELKFSPEKNGIHSVYIYFNGKPIKGTFCAFKLTFFLLFLKIKMGSFPYFIFLKVCHFK